MAAAPAASISRRTPWQLALYNRALKKRRTLGAVLELLPPLDGKRCLEIGCQTGVTSYFLRQRGGDWTSVDFEADHVESTRQLVGPSVLLVTDKDLPFKTDEFDVVVGINFLEHIVDDDRFLAEMARVLKPGGTFILTAPSGENWRLAYRLKRVYGFTADTGGFGHARDGYPPAVFRRKLASAGLAVDTVNSYSRLFGELVEDTLNYVYFRKATAGSGPTGTAEHAPPQHAHDHDEDHPDEPRHHLGEHGHFHGHTTVSSERSFRRVGLLFRLYSLLFPALKAMTMLDGLIPFSPGYMLAARAHKLAAP